MALMQRFRAALSALAGRTQEPTTVIIHESLGPPGQGASEDYGYRRLSRDDRRDLSVVAHDRMLKMATWLMASNPIAKRGIQNTTAFVTSEGYKIRATSKDSNSQAIVQRELDKHWKLCAWEDELTQRVTSLGVEGEWAFWAPSRANGHFELCKILPEQVDVIVRDGINAERLKTLHLVQPMRFRWDDGPWERRDAFSLVHEDLWTDQLCGEVLYLGINRLGGQTRGWSDLLPVVDWLDQLDKTLFTEAERVAFQRAFAWDVTLKGADEAKIEARKQKIQEAGPPKPGSVNVHNDSEIWDCKSPDLKLQDSVAFIQFLMMLCFGGLNMPEHFYASGGDVNKACHSADTETLTSGGWKHLDELDGNETIATFNPETGGMEWHAANSFHVYEHDGEMVHFSNKLVDVLVTPEHRMYAKRPRNNPESEAYEIVQAQEIVSHGWKIPVAGNWLGGTDADFELPAVATGCSRAIYPALTIPGDLWAEFLGYFLSEGHVHTKKDGCYLVQLSQKKPGGIEKIRTCLQAMDALGFSFRETVRPDGAIIWQCSDKGLHTWLVGNCGRLAKDKRLPVGAFGWTARRMAILFDALMLGDGTVDSRENRNSGCYYTSSKELADQVQTLCFMLGKQARITPGTRCYRLTVCDRTEAAMDKESLKRVDYTGKVYCFNVPNHLFITRRNGKVAVSHNTAAEMGTPIWAHIRDRKREIKRFMRQAARLCLQRVHAVGGRLSQVPLEHCTFEVVSRDPDRTAYDLIGAMLKSVGEAQAFAAERNWITQEEAARSYREAASGLGLGDFLPHAIPKSLADARTQGDQALEHRRPQLSLVKPIADPQDQEAS